MVLLAVACLSALVHIAAEYRGPRALVYVCKPLTTTLLIAAVMVAGEDSRYRTLILAGLVLSLAGDVFLMLPRDLFLPGLISFLLAHLAYIAAFGFRASVIWLIPYALIALVVLRLLWPGVPKAMRVPVIVYVAALIVMAWQSIPRVPIGGALFVASDATLAWNRFRTPFRAAQAVIMSTYVAAQVLIAATTIR
ncbi:MAG TPA: lysoplasmalogenase [Thermoanaerobaculia bacterium]